MEKVEFVVKKESPYKFVFNLEHEEEEPDLDAQNEWLAENAQELGPRVAAIREQLASLPFEAAPSVHIKEGLKRASVKCFIDPDFPPINSSLYDLSEDYPFSQAVHWRRPKEFMKGKISLFESGIDPFDVIQGDLKNAWLMAALVGMAENPKLIERLFVSKKYNEQGFYKIRICVNGEWSVVVVDDYIPCQINGGPIFT